MSDLKAVLGQPATIFWGVNGIAATQGAVIGICHEPAALVRDSNGGVFMIAVSQIDRVDLDYPPMTSAAPAKR